MRRTTLSIEESLFRALKRRAAEEERTLQDLLNVLLSQALQPTRRRPSPLQWKTFKGKGLQPGVDLDDRDRLFDILDERR